MNGPEGKSQVMPMCMGTAAGGHGPYDLSSCTCDRPKARQVLKVERKVAALEKRVRELEARIDLLTKRLVAK